ncbi:MAG: hypothetical protein HW380_3458, partial [Magnetococcales bacterium]|nr:hypothetical protein [Magnetococcales bacterium]
LTPFSQFEYWNLSDTPPGPPQKFLPITMLAHMGIIPPGLRFGGRASKVSLLILTFLPPEGGQGAQPQSFRDVLEIEKESVGGPFTFRGFFLFKSFVDF